MAIKTSFFYRMVDPYISGNKRLSELIEKLNLEYKTNDETPLEVEIKEDSQRRRLLLMTANYHSIWEGESFWFGRKDYSFKGSYFHPYRLGIDYEGVRLTGFFDSIPTELFLPIETKRHETILHHNFGIINQISSRRKIRTPYVKISIEPNGEGEKEPLLYLPSLGDYLGLEITFDKCSS